MGRHGGLFKVRTTEAEDEWADRARQELISVMLSRQLGVFGLG
jgi:hypothetical protein